MSAPRRWLDAPEQSSDEERALLRLGLDVDPPDEAEDRTWQALVGSLGPGGPPQGPDDGGGPPPSLPSPPAPPAPPAAPLPGVTGAGAGGLGLALKATLSLVVAGGLTMAGYQSLGPSSPPTVPATAAVASIRNQSSPPDQPAQSAQPASPSPGPSRPAAEAPSAGAATPAGERSHRPPPQVVPHGSSQTDEAPRGAAAVATASPLPSPVEPAAEPQASAPPQALQAPQAPAAVAASPASSSEGAAEPAPSPQAERASRLREESALVGQANAAVRSGNGALALRLLAEADQRFPGGVLGQERELLTIEALAASGQRAAASQRAAAFLQAHPKSPHAARLRPFLP